LAYTFFPGSRLVQQEAILTTNDPDVAYYYDAGLDMAAPADRTAGNNMKSEVAYYDTSGRLKREIHNGLQAEREPVKVRYRTLAAKTAGGSIACFLRRIVSSRATLESRPSMAPRLAGRVGIGVRQLRDENWRYFIQGQRASGTRSG
jgi:hypothetical protein